MIVSCDKCGENFEVINKEEKITGNIKRVYFKCKHCGEKYNAYYTDASIRKKQAELNKLRTKAKRCKGEETYKKLENKFNKLSLEVKQDMQNLRKKFEES